MFGNKNAGDEIAREFLKLIKTATIEEVRGGESPPAPTSSINAADFLVSPVEDEASEPSSSLDEKISEVDSYANDAKDGSVNCACDRGMCADDGCDCDCDCDCDCGCGCEKEENSVEDFALNSSAKEILFGLGKVARSLRDKGENFAADMVEVTALDISKDLAAEAAKKMFVVDELKKVEASFEDDKFAADMVKAAIAKIKNS